jgi:hypothetical protein
MVFIASNNTVFLPGNVGIGTSSPSSKLEVSGSAVISATDNTNAALRITQLGSGNALLVEDSTNPDATPFVISNSGEVVVGGTTPTVEQFGGTARLSVITTGDPYYAASFSTFSNDQFESVLSLLKSRSGTTGGQTVLQSGDSVGSIRFQGSDGTGFIQAANITTAVDGTPGTNDMPGRLVFATTADGASSPTERMRINNGGQVGIGVASVTTSLLSLGGTAPSASGFSNFTNMVYL